MPDAKVAGNNIVGDAHDDAEQVVSDVPREAVEIVLAGACLRRAPRGAPPDIDGLSQPAALPETTSNGGYNGCRADR